MLIFGWFKTDLARAAWIFVGIALAGTLAALHAPRTPPGNRGARLALDPWRAFRDSLAEARRVPVLLQTVLGIAYFSMLGSLFLAIIPIYGRNFLGLSEQRAGLLLMLLSVGIAIGSLTAGKLSEGRVEIGLVPLGSLGMTLSSLDLALFGGRGGNLLGLPARATIDLLLLGLSAGLYIVPLNALLQQRSPAGMKGRLVAFSNVLAFAAVLAAAAIPWLLSSALGWSSRQLVLCGALMTLAGTLYVLSLLPHFLVRLILWLLTHTFYRIQVAGAENLPARGGLLVANHVSWVDALLIGAASDRMVRFMMYRPFYEAPLVHWFFRRMGVIPIAAEDTAEQKEASLAQARQEIAEGHLVCVFAEGAITRTGNLLRFRRGFERIAQGMDAPIVPVCLDGVWGGLFSYERGRLLLKRPRRVLEPVRVLFGEPMPPSSKTFEVRLKIQELSVEGFRLRKSAQWPLELELVRSAKRRWRRPLLIDSDGRVLRQGQALARALALRAPLFGDRRPTPGTVCILLPPGAQGALATLSALAAGKVVAHLDAAAGAELLRREVELARPECVVTSRALLVDPARREALRDARLVLIEEAEASLPALELFLLGLTCRLLPAGLIARFLLGGTPGDVDRTAAVIFSFPQPGGPSRSVALSHHNILSNIESLKQVFRLSREDRILGVLPLSSSFGLTGTLLLPAIGGIPVVYHQDPWDVETVARLSVEQRITILPVAPAHLAAYTGKIPALAFRHLRHALTSGAGLTPELRERFRELYGVEPLEGFGCAECSPLISLNVPTTAGASQGQTGRRAGTSGHPLPGIAIKIVDPQSGAALPPDREGLLLVKGPNVMQGYLNDPAGTEQVLSDGWFHTGVVASQDDDGFLTLRDTTAPERQASQPS